MADAAVKDAAPAKTAAPAAEPAKKGGLMGPLLAVVVLLAIGGGVGFVVASAVPALSGKSDAAQAEGADKAEKGEKGEKKGNALAGLTEIVLNDLVTNVKNQDGRRYVKVSCSIWVAEKDEKRIAPDPISAGEGTPQENETVKRILRMRLEEHMKSYDMVDLTSPTIYTQLQNGFRDAIERELHAIYTDVGPEYRFVKRIVLTNLLVQ